MSTLSPPNPSNRHPDRAPPPSLFLGPPSRNTSTISLSPTNPPNPPNQQPHDPLLRPRANAPNTLDSKPSFIRSRSRPPPTNPSQATQPTKSATPSTNQEADRTDALWAEMQATLAEVELSAFSSTHVFGAKHAEALEELRGAQVLLARAWGASEDDGDGEDGNGDDGGGEKEGEDGEDEEQVDIRVARKRREANERFFKKVQVGVEDVVGKLENVAAAMGRVERESREIWESGSDSLDSGSVTS